MKKLIYILAVIILLACNSENAGDCFQTEGTIIQQEVAITPFENILVNRDIELIVKDGPDYEVVIETGENLINDVEAIVVGDELQLTDNNTCNYVREYGITKVFVTAPNINVIRSSTQYDISSDGILTYQNLSLFSEDFIVPDTFTMGDFRLTINNSFTRVVTNNLSSIYISGQTETLNIKFASGAGRFHGEALIAQNVHVYHRGSNDIFVNPQQSLSGELRGTGDLISLNNPPTVEVEQFYIGELIFQ